MNAKRALAVLLCAGFAAPAMAQSFKMTHNLVDDFLEAGTVACAGGEPQTTGANTVWRAFDLVDFGLGDITVQEVEFGIERFFAPTHGNMTEVTIELFQAPEGTAPTLRLELKGSATAEFEDQTLTIVSMAVEGCIDAGSALIVAITVEDFGGGAAATGDVAFVGSNGFGETDFSYLSSIPCGLGRPTAFKDVGEGFPNVHILMNILGVEGHECSEECYADCDSSGALDFFDFLCFQNAFAAGESYADCDESGSLDFFDFLCFQNEFAAGCP
jgi:hypothetical protein